MAHTDLNIFAAVEALLEHSLVSVACYDEVQDIIARWRRAEQTCVGRYDATLAALEQ